MKKLAFIGTGNMGGAIFKAVCTETSPKDIVIYDADAAKCSELCSKYGCDGAECAAEAAAQAEYVIMGVKPNIIRNVLAEISPVISSEATIVSMAAGITAETIRSSLGKNNDIIRIIPNTPCEIGKGLMLLIPCYDISSDKISEVRAILSPCGLTGISDETHADACMTIGGCTPAYVYMFIEALADGAVACGLKRDDALAFAAKAVEGAASMVLQSGKHPGALKDSVCSPGGSTIKGVQILEDRGFRGSVIDCIASAYEKNSSLGK